MKTIVIVMFAFSVLLPFIGAFMCLYSVFSSSSDLAIVGQALVICGLVVSNFFIKIAEFSDKSKFKLYNMADYNKRK